MATTLEQIDRWRQSPTEHQQLEFKKAENQFSSERLFKYCVAMANEGGGHLLLGIEDKPPRRVTGTKAVNNPVGMAEKILNAVGFRVDVEEIQHPDGRVVVFSIPSRPRGAAYRYDDRYWMRSGASLVVMSDDRLRKIFDEGKPDWLEEYAVTGLDAGEVVELLDTQTFFELLGNPYPSDRAGVIDRLAGERLVDEAGSGYGIRRMGAVLLAKNLSNFPELAGKAPRVIVYEGTSKLNTLVDQTGGKGYAVGFQGLVSYIMTLLPQNEVIRDALRRLVKLVPEGVVRELAANILIHQDFSISGASAMVEIYNGRVEFSSPGDPVVPVDRFIDGYESRNERLADLMRRMGICERKSSGIDNVVSTAEKFQLPAPDFTTSYRRTISTIYGPIPFDEMSGPDRVRACYQHCCLRYVMSERMTNGSLRERFRLPESKTETASRIIRDTLAEDRIKVDAASGGSKRYAKYIPIWA